MTTPRLNRREFVAGTGMTLFGALGTANARPDDPDSPSHWGPSIVAHRGFAGIYPENTAMAARRAARGPHYSRAAMIEIDVMPTGDGDVVVFHDDRLSSRDGGERGLTDESGVVWETPTDVVTSATVLESTETVPLLSDVLAEIPPHVGVNVEFKNPGSHDVVFGPAGDAIENQRAIWRPFTERVLDICTGVDNPVLVSSFYEAAIAEVREQAPTLPVGFLFWDSIVDGLEVVRRYDCEAIHPPRNMIKGTPFFGDAYYTSGPFANIDLIDVARAEDRVVNVYTITDWFQATQLADAGVNGLICDYPHLISHPERTTSN